MVGVHQPLRSAGAGEGVALGAAVGKAVDHGGEVDVELVRQRRHPGQHVTELVFDLGPGALADGLSEFTELFGEPCDGGCDATVSVEGVSYEVEPQLVGRPGEPDRRRRIGPDGRVVGCDFSEPMLELARRKSGDEDLPVEFGWADALDLPYGDGSFDAVTIGFGARNLADLGLPILLWDERWSTVSAERALIEQDMSRARDHRGVHRGRGRERAAEEPADRIVAEMGVGGEVMRHAILSRGCGGSIDDRPAE